MMSQVVWILSRLIEMPLFYFGVVIIAIALCFTLLVTYLKKNTSVFKIAVFSVALFITFYLLVAAGLLWISSFTPMLSVVIVIIIFAVLMLIRIKHFTKGKTFLDYNFKGELAALLIVLAILPFVQLKEQAINVYSDAGSYGFRALAFYHGDTSTTNEIYEFRYFVGDEENRASLWGISGAAINRLHSQTTDEYFYHQVHALPTWSTLITLYGKVFGYSAMFNITSLLLILSGMLVYYIVERFNRFKYAKYLCVFIFCFSPLTVYLTKSTLTETSQAFLLLLAISLIFGENRSLRYFGAFALAAIGYVHISMIMIFPIIYIGLTVIGMIEEDASYFITNSILCYVYAFSLLFSYSVSETYTADILYMSLGVQMYANAFILLFTIVVTILALLQIALTLANKKMKIAQKRIAIFVDKRGSMLLKVYGTILLLGTAIQGYRLGFTEDFVVGGGSWAFRAAYANRGFYSLLHLNLFNIMIASAVICLPYIIYRLYRKNGSFTIHEKLFFGIIFYALSIYTFMRPDTPHNPYGSRYFFTLIIPAIIILVGMLIKSKRATIIIATICLLFSMPFNLYLAQNQGYKNQREVFEDVAGVIPEGAVVFVDAANSKFTDIIVHNLRNVNDNKVFNISNVEVISGKLSEYPQYYVTVQESQNLTDRVFARGYLIGCDTASFYVFYPLPNNVFRNSFHVTVFVYRLNPEVHDYTLNHILGEDDYSTE